MIDHSGNSPAGEQGCDDFTPNHHTRGAVTSTKNSRKRKGQRAASTNRSFAEFRLSSDVALGGFSFWIPKAPTNRLDIMSREWDNTPRGTVSSLRKVDCARTFPHSQDSLYFYELVNTALSCTLHILERSPLGGQSNASCSGNTPSLGEITLNHRDPGPVCDLPRLNE